MLPGGVMRYQGIAKLDRRTKDLVKRLGPDDIAVIDPSDKHYIRLEFQLRHLHDIVLLHDGDPQQALSAARQTEQDWQTASRGRTIPDSDLIQARIAEVLGSAQAANGDLASARATWQAEADRLDAAPNANLPVLALRRLLAIDLGDRKRAQEIAAQLEAADYRDPRTDPAYTLSGRFR